MSRGITAAALPGKALVNEAGCRALVVKTQTAEQVLSPGSPRQTQGIFQRSVFYCAGLRLADPMDLLRDAATMPLWGQGRFPIRGEGPHLLAGFILGSNGLVVAVRSTTLCLL